MPIKFRCLYCDKLLGIARRKAGTVVSCPQCGRAVTVPMENPSAERRSAKPASILERRDFDRLLVKPGASKRSTSKENGESIKPEAAAEVPATEPQPIPSPPPPQVPLRDPDSEELDELEAVPSALDDSDEEFGEPALSAPPPPPPRRHAGPDHSTLGTIIAIATLLLVFGLGILVGRYVVPVQPNGASSLGGGKSNKTVVADAEATPPLIAAPQPAMETPKAAVPRERPVLTGRIFFSANGEPKPDEGATVLAFPTSQSPVRKVATLGLRPLDQNLQDKPGVEQLRHYGGALSTVDDIGDFRIEVDQPGMYYVLILSKRAERSLEEPLYRDDVAILQRFFEDGEQLLGSSAFLLVTRDLQLKDNEPVRFTF